MEGVDTERIKRIIYEHSKVGAGRAAPRLPPRLLHFGAGDAAGPLGGPPSSLLQGLAVQGTPHFENERRKERATEARIARMQAEARQLSHAELAARTSAMDAKLAELEASRDLSRTWVRLFCRWASRRVEQNAQATD